MSWGEIIGMILCGFVLLLLVLMAIATDAKAEPLTLEQQAEMDELFRMECEMDEERERRATYCICCRRKMD